MQEKVLRFLDEHKDEMFELLSELLKIDTQNYISYGLEEEGQQFFAEQISAEGPAAYMTPLPVHDMIAAMQSAGIPAQLSLSAGAYVCNDVYYALLSCFERGLFLHVPDADVVDADTAARAITICLEHS